MAKVWPSLYSGDTADITSTVEDTVDYLREHYGHARTKDVKRALELLDHAGLAAEQPDGTWLVSRTRLTTKNGEREISRNIAARAVGRQRRAVPRATPTGPTPVQGQLF